MKLAHEFEPEQYRNSKGGSMNSGNNKILSKKLRHLAIFAAIATSMSYCSSPDQTAQTATPSTANQSSPWGVPVVANSEVSLSIQGAKPAVLALAGSAIEVKNADGSVAGTLDLSYATLVMDKIKLKLAEPASLSENSEEEAQGDSAVEDSEQPSAALNEDPAEVVSSDSASQTGSDAGEDDQENEKNSYGYEFSGPFLVDLLTNTMTPDASSLSAPAGLYKEVELSVHKVEDEDAVTLGIDENHDLYKKSIVVKGIYTPTAGSAVNFMMSYELSEEFKLAGSSGASIIAGQLNDIVIAFRMASWFDFANAESNPDQLGFASLPAGDIVLEEGSDEISKQIRDIIKDNIKSSADFGKDKDGDGELSNDEDSESAAEESVIEIEAEAEVEGQSAQ